jgi:hypothetical protein
MQITTTTTPTPTLYRLCYRRRVTDPWLETPPMDLQAVLLTRARLLPGYAIIVRQWLHADGTWIG